MGSVCLAGRLQASSSPDGADQALTAGARIGVKGQTSEQGDGARGIPLPLLWLAGSSYTDLGVKASCLCQTECPSLYSSSPPGSALLSLLWDVPSPALGQAIPRERSRAQRAALCLGACLPARTAEPAGPAAKNSLRKPLRLQHAEAMKQMVSPSTNGRPSRRASCTHRQQEGIRPPVEATVTV